MANAPMTNFFVNAQANRLALVPAGQPLAKLANQPAGGSAAVAYNSRVHASQVNGAQSPADPVNAPWTWLDFVTGSRSLTNTPAKAVVKSKGRFSR